MGYPCSSLHCINESRATDPACGSGNFLTETYLSLRKLENKVIAELISLRKKQLENQIVFGGTSDEELIKVSIGQFYGIEINDFAVSVAKTALWIAENQMLRETEKIINQELDFLPLKTNAYIIEANALRLDWQEVVPKYELSYIMGNPPFVGSARLDNEQKIDREKIFPIGGGELDYVSCWYKKATDYMKGTNIHCAFVSTNSICQGQQVVPLWQPLFESGIKINFAYHTFRWDSEADKKAQVHCIIIGFSYIRSAKAHLFTNKDNCKEVDNINAYLMDAPNVFVGKRSNPICNVPKVIKGFQPTDHKNLLLSDSQKSELIDKEPNAEKWIRPFISAREYIHGINRWCLWLDKITPAELNRMPYVKERVSACKSWREAQTKTGDAYKLKDTPWLMRQNSKFKETDFIVLPLHSGEVRKYVPFGFAKAGTIPGNSVSIICDASLYLFGVLTSNVHMAWMRAVCGRLEMRYRYSSDIVYNNFPWCNPTAEQKAKIEKTAQGILDARALYPDSSLADLYDEAIMPLELRKAHQANDAAVAEAYGIPKDMPEAEVVAMLMKRYQELTSK